MVILYNLGIRVYLLLIRVASIKKEKARQWLAGRKSLFTDIKGKLDPKRPVIWFHCASLGEFEQGRPVIEEIKKQDPLTQIVLTFFSPSGYLVRKNYDKADLVCYLPLDTRKNATRFIELIHPEKVFFIKYEFWYHFLHELHRRNIPTYIISAIFRKNQVFFKPWGKWYRKMLHTFTFLFVQDEESKELLNCSGIRNVIASGDTRFDRVFQIAKQAKELPVISDFTANHPVIIAGSSWEADEEFLCRYINEDSSDTRYIVAPHEITPSHLALLNQRLTVPVKYYSEIQQEEDLSNYKVLIINTYGILSSVYRYGKIAYIGGGFGVGIHNILEAATYGMPVVFGPNYEKFKEAKDLIEQKGAFSIPDYSTLKTIFDRFLSSGKALQEAGEKAEEYVKANRGATSKILLEINH